MDKGSRKNLPAKPVVIIRRKAGPKSAPTGPVQATPRAAAPVSKATKPAIPVQSQQVQQSVPLQASAPPAVTETGPSNKEQEKHACRELLDVMRQRWPQAFP